MIEKPDLSDETITACLQQEYGLQDIDLTFLPLGADPNTGVYRARTLSEGSYFVKLRKGAFDETGPRLCKAFADLAIKLVIGPVGTLSGCLWSRAGAFTLVVYPFVEGRNGYECTFSVQHWRAFGSALKGIHTAALPPTITRLIPQET